MVTINFKIGYIKIFRKWIWNILKLLWPHRYRLLFWSSLIWNSCSNICCFQIGYYFIIAVLHNSICKLIIFYTIYSISFYRKALLELQQWHGLKMEISLPSATQSELFYSLTTMENVKTNLLLSQLIPRYNFSLGILLYIKWQFYIRLNKIDFFVGKFSTLKIVTQSKD